MTEAKAVETPGEGRTNVPGPFWGLYLEDLIEIAICILLPALGIGWLVWSIVEWLS